MKTQSDRISIFLGFITNPPNLLPFKTPVLILSGGIDNVPTLPPPPPAPAISLACAPDAISNDRFYQSLSGPTWLLNFTKFGHADMLDDSFILSPSAVCPTCTRFLDATTCNYAQFRQDEANAIADFTNGLVDCGQRRRELRFLTNPEHYFESQVTFKSNGFSIKKLNGFCQNYP